MRKTLMASFLFVTVGVLTACSTANNTKPSETTPSSTVASSSTEEEKTAIFTATVKEVTELDTKEKAIQVLLENPENVENAEDMLVSFKDGVALNLDPTTFKFEQSDLIVGTKIQVTVSEHAPMTMSIPPQIPGNAIFLVEIVK